MKPVPNHPSEVTYRLMDHDQWGLALKKYVRGMPAHSPMCRPVVLTCTTSHKRTVYPSTSLAATALGVSQLHTALENGTTVKGHKVSAATKRDVLRSNLRVTDHTAPTATTSTVERKATQPRTTGATPIKVTLAQLQTFQALVSAHMDIQTMTSKGYAHPVKAKINQALRDLVTAEAKALGMDLSL